MLRLWSLSFPTAVLVLAITSLVVLSAKGTELRRDTPAPGTATSPVLVELFTSEGCSDCPPADALLERLDRSQPVDRAELIVLSEHVDYWNDIGWRDPYSSHQFSERQSNYAGLFGLDSVYTPQMVIDGSFQFVGSDEARAIQAAENASRLKKIPVNISSVHLESPHELSLHIEANQLPSSLHKATSATVLLAIADERDESHVSGGENGGRTLKHIAVVRSLAKVGTVNESAEFSREIKIKLNQGRKDIRLIAFVQDEKTGRIWGVGSARLSN